MLIASATVAAVIVLSALALVMRRRQELHAGAIKIFADVDKKHSVRFPGIDLATHIEWTRFFGADAMIISGRMTGDAPDLDKVREARRMLGSYVLTEHDLLEARPHEDAVAFGS